MDMNLLSTVTIVNAVSRIAVNIAPLQWLNSNQEGIMVIEVAHIFISHSLFMTILCYSLIDLLRYDLPPILLLLNCECMKFNQENLSTQLSLATVYSIQG